MIKEFHVTALANRPPVVAGSDVTATTHGEVFNASNLISASDPDGDAITMYTLYDNTIDPNTGHFSVNGVVQTKVLYQPITLTAQQFAQTTFKTGASGSDDLYVSAFDGTSWSTIKEFHVAALANRPPVVAASDVTLPGATSVAMGSLLSASDPDGDAITMYTLYDNTIDPNTGHFSVNGVVQAKVLYQPITLTAQQFAQTTFQTGKPGSDDLYVSAFDGTSWSAIREFHVNAVNNAPVTIGAGQTVEIGSSYSGVVTFASLNGTLKLDASTNFTGTIAGQLAIGDVIDLADITAGAAATIGYTGIGAPGTLTVSDGTHTAHITLTGNYSLANFTASSDGHSGTSVVDPPLSSAASMPRAASVSITPIATGADTQLAATSAAAVIEYGTVASVTVATIAPLSDGTASGSGAAAPVALPVSQSSLENASSVASAGLSGERSLEVLVQPAGGSAAPALDRGDSAVFPVAELPQTAIAREIVSPDDLILAIRKGDIALKIDPSAGESAERSPWLFDEEQGTFEAPRPEQLTIFVDQDDDDGLVQTGNLNSRQALAGEAVVVPDQSWFGAIRMAWMQPMRSWWWR